MTRARRLLFLSSVVGALTLPDAASAQAARGINVLEAAAERYAQVSALCADFVQRLEIPLLGDVKTGSGRLCQAQPSRFGMRFADPKGDLVLADGEWVWLFYPSVDDQQVIRLAMQERAGGYDFHREFFDRPRAKYEVTYEAAEVVAGHRTDRLRLVPRGPASYRAAVVWIDQGVPVLRRIRIEEDSESIRTVTLENVVFEPADLSDDWFVFDPPPGVQVISRK